MKHLLITTIAAVLLVGCGESPPSKPLSEADKALLKDAGKGDLEAVKQHLAAGADLNVKDFIGDTPLHLAAYGTPAADEMFGSRSTFGNNEVVKLLIAEGVDVNARDVRGWTPLHYAARVGHKEVAQLLIDNGADVNARDENGDTSVDWTTQFG